MGVNDGCTRLTPMTKSAFYTWFILAAFCRTRRHSNRQNWEQSGPAIALLILTHDS